MSSRSQVLQSYKSSATMVRIQYESSVRVFRTDSASEYLSRELRGFLAEQGTLPRYSYPGAHARNGVAERKHRHILETIFYCSPTLFLEKTRPSPRRAWT